MCLLRRFLADAAVMLLRSLCDLNRNSDSSDVAAMLGAVWELTTSMAINLLQLITYITHASLATLTQEKYKQKTLHFAGLQLPQSPGELLDSKITYFLLNLCCIASMRCSKQQWPAPSCSSGTFILLCFVWQDLMTMCALSYLCQTIRHFQF